MPRGHLSSLLLARDFKPAGAPESERRTFAEWLTDIDRSRILNPSHFDGSGDADADDTEAVQALVDYARSTYDADLRGFTAHVDLGNRVWNVSSIDLTLLRQPGLRVKNGALHGIEAGKIVLDVSGSNAITFENFGIFSSKDNAPDIGILMSRAQIGSAFPGAPNMKMFGVVINGYFAKASIVNFASEVFSNSLCFFINKHRSSDAYTYVHVGHAATLDAYLGGVASEFCTIPTAADGPQSNILHYLSQPHIMRDSDIVLTATGITKANPAVVTVNAAALTAAGLENGEEVYFHQVAGMTELNGNAYTVANVNLGAGTFELQGVDSTGYGTFTSGIVWNKTGPAMLLNRAHMMSGRSGYLLTYGSPGIVVDALNGDPPRALDLEFSHEAEPPCTMRIDHGADPVIWQGCRLKNLSSSQFITDCVIDDDGAGTIRFDGLDLEITNMGEVPVNKTFKNPSKFTIRNVNISMPKEAALNDPADFAAMPSGRFIAYDRATIIHELLGDVYNRPEFFTDLPGNGVATGVLLDDGDGHGPFWDSFRDSASPAALDGLGGVRLYGRDSAGNKTLYGTIRGRIVDPTDGSEDGRVEFTVSVNGVETMPFYLTGTQLVGPGGLHLLTSRQTGFVTAVGTDNPDASGINTDTITATDANIRAVSAWVKAIHNALAAHGLIGA